MSETDPTPEARGSESPDGARPPRKRVAGDAAPRRRVVGVLGGMGPEATVLLMRRIIAATPAEDDADHVPLLVDHNPQTPSRIAALIEGTGESPAPVLASMARRLVDAGAEALAMPCNTAHGFADAIREAAPEIPFLDMIALTADRLARARPGSSARIGMLASPATRRIGLFDRAFAAHGLAPLWVEDEAALLDAIRRLKRNGADPAARDAHLAAAEALLDSGADALCVACTEFSLIADAAPPGAPVVDALDVLAEAVRDFSLGG